MEIRMLLDEISMGKPWNCHNALNPYQQVRLSQSRRGSSRLLLRLMHIRQQLLHKLIRHS